MSTSKLLLALGATLLFAVPAPAQAPANGARDPGAQSDRGGPPVGQPGAEHGSNQTARGGQSGEKIGVQTIFPVKNKLAGLNVRNSAGEKLGTVEDLVIDLQSGKAQYIAVSFGGVLGIGSKYFAIPFQDVRFNHGRDEMYFVLDISKDKLENAPGFDKNDWPDFADPNWKSKVDNYYKTNSSGTAGRNNTAPSNTRQ